MASLHNIRDIYNSMSFPYFLKSRDENDKMEQVHTFVPEKHERFKRTAKLLRASKFPKREQLAKYCDHFSKRSTFEDYGTNAPVLLIFGRNTSLLSLALELCATLFYESSSIYIQGSFGNANDSLDKLMEFFINSGWSHDRFKWKGEMCNEEATVVTINCDHPKAFKTVNYGGTTMIILEGADLQSAVEQLVWSTWGSDDWEVQDWSVSTCLVSEALLSTFKEKLQEMCESLAIDLSKITRFSDPDIQEGINEAIREARKVGANVQQFASTLTADAWSPTVIYEFQLPNTKPWTVLSVFSFRSIREAVRIANQTPFCLATSVWGGSPQDSLAAGNLLESNIVWVNCHGEHHLEMPILPSHQNGFGSFGGIYSVPMVYPVKYGKSWGSNRKLLEETVIKLGQIKELEEYHKHFVEALYNPCKSLWIQPNCIRVSQPLGTIEVDTSLTELCRALAFGNNIIIKNTNDKIMKLINIFNTVLPQGAITIDIGADVKRKGHENFKENPCLLYQREKIIWFPEFADFS